MDGGKGAQGLLRGHEISLAGKGMPEAPVLTGKALQCLCQRASRLYEARIV